MGFISHSVAVVEVSYSGDRWYFCAIKWGDGNFCYVSEGESILHSTGGWHFSLGVQLPNELADGWIAELKTIADRPNKNVRKLNPGEIIAQKFEHPNGWNLVSGGDASLGTLTIV